MTQWTVLYDDGTMLHEYSPDHPDAVRGYVSAASIHWQRVRSIYLVTADAINEVAIGGHSSRYRWSLRRRTWEHPLDIRQRIVLLILVLSQVGEQASDENTVAAIYGLPDGRLHRCGNLYCPAVDRFCTALIGGEHPELPTSCTGLSRY